MYFQKRYSWTERDEKGKLLCTGEFSTPEEFDRHAAQWPPMKGHTLTLFDTWSPLDIFGLFHKVVREVKGE